MDGKNRNDEKTTDLDETFDRLSLLIQEKVSRMVGTILPEKIKKKVKQDKKTKGG